MSWRENWGSGRDASTSGAKNSRPSSQEKKQHVQARTRLQTEKKTNSSSGCWRRRPWKWIFSEVPCKKSRLDARRAAKLARRDLRANPRSNAFARQPEYRAHVPLGSGQSQKFLSVAERAATCRRRDRGFTNQHRRIHRRVLQSAALALCAGLSIPRRIRVQGRMSGRKSRCNDRGFGEQKERQKDFEGAAGDWDSDAVPFPRPLLLLEDARTLIQKRKLCPNDLCHERGSPQIFRPTSVQLRGE